MNTGQDYKLGIQNINFSGVPPSQYVFLNTSEDATPNGQILDRIQILLRHHYNDIRSCSLRCIIVAFEDKFVTPMELFDAYTETEINTYPMLIQPNVNGTKLCKIIYDNVFIMTNKFQRVYNADNDLEQLTSNTNYHVEIDLDNLYIPRYKRGGVTKPYFAMLLFKSLSSSSNVVYVKYHIKMQYSY